MTRPPIPSAAALEAAALMVNAITLKFRISSSKIVEWRQRFAHDLDAFAAQAVAAERAKPVASTREIARKITRDAFTIWTQQRTEDEIAAALAERGERERDAGWNAAVQKLRDIGGSWNCDGSEIADHLAAIRNQTLTGD